MVCGFVLVLRFQWWVWIELGMMGGSGGRRVEMEERGGRVRNRFEEFMEIGLYVSSHGFQKTERIMRQS